MRDRPRRVIGSGLEVSSIGLGCFPFSGSYGQITEAAALAVLDTAIEEGITFLDTADAYGPYTSERIVAKTIRTRRSEIQLATKFGARLTGEGGFCGTREYVHGACDDSLARLEADYIDLYYLHRVDPSVPIEETVGAMAELVQLGKVRQLGLCEVGPSTLRRACAVHPIAALQSEWSLWARDIEKSVVQAARELGVTLVPYSPLGRGFLTGRVKALQSLDPEDMRRTLPRFEPENFRRNLGFVERLEEFAAEKRCTPAQLALAWLLAQGPDVVPIPGANRPEHVRENAGAAKVHLTADDLRRIDDFASGDGAIAGARGGARQAMYVGDE